MAKVWVLDTETKGTGAHMVPLDDVLEKPAPDTAPRRAPRPRSRPDGSPAKRPPARSAQPVERTSTALPAGHVRKKSTGEIGRVRAVDARAGTATVHWLKHGRTSTVRLSAISRR